MFSQPLLRSKTSCKYTTGFNLYAGENITHPSLTSSRMSIIWTAIPTLHWEDTFISSTLEFFMSTRPGERGRDQRAVRLP